MKRYILPLFFLTSLGTATIAQPVYDFGKLITGSVEDSKYLAGGYINPFMKAFGYGMNNGWYNSAAPHKLGGFDLTVTGSLAFAPLLDQTYLVDNSKMSNTTHVTDITGTKAIPTGNVPTVFGAQGTKPFYRSPSASTNVFNGPEGAGASYLPMPAVTLGIGLPVGFELRVRYSPTIDISKVKSGYTGSFGMFGVGIMHDIKQWIPGVKALPFDISAFVGYTKVNFIVGIDTSKPNNKAEFSSSATTIQALVGKKISILAVYGSVGYNIATTDLAVKGNYDLDKNAATADVKDPFKLSTESNGFRGTLGMRIRLAVIAFHADYSFQKYRTITGGFGINFR